MNNYGFPTINLLKSTCFNRLLNNDSWSVETISLDNEFHALITRTAKKCFLQFTRDGGRKSLNEWPRVIWSWSIFKKLSDCSVCLQCFNTVGCVSGRASLLQKNWVMRYWHGYMSGARCKWFARGPGDATTTRSSLSALKIQIGPSFPVPAYPGCPGKGAVKRVSVLHFSE